MIKNINNTLIISGLAILTIFTISGCTYPGDTSGYQPEKKQSKQEINKYIEEVQNNPKMPPSAKAMAIDNLKKKLADTK